MAGQRYDVVVVGGGILGLATAMELLSRHPDLTLAVLEKETKLATHQTGHNSGVIHSGIYYRPGSYKARLCVEGARLMVEFCAAQGITITTGAEVRSIARVGRELELRTAWSGVRARGLVNCAGLYSDVVARMAGANTDVHIIPFRGEYYFIRPEKHDLVRGLIYPVPDPEFPFLGVHLTRTVHGDVEAGPNAVLAFAREGYRFGRVNLRELAATLGYRGFRAMARRYWRTGTYEMYRSLSRAAFARAL